MWRCLPLTLSGGVAVLWLSLVVSDGSSAPRPDTLRSPRSSAVPWTDLTLANPRYEGVGGCAAVACHGGSTRGAKGSEYTTWATYDPHRLKAFAVLQTDRSRRILKNYNRLERLSEARPERETLCLRCHSQTAPLKGTSLADAADGVGCEACHGPSQEWRLPHYGAGWAALSVKQKASLGFRPTKDLASCAAMCASCHVGENLAMQVNHDLIAAGHPRLNFEFSAYLARYTRDAAHWSPSADRQRHPDLQTRSWLIGQLISARKALTLLRDRARSAAMERSDKAPWPELAESDCFACHHGLRGESWRQVGGHRGKPGQIPWGTWYYALLPEVSRAVGGKRTLSSTVAELQRKLEETARPQDVLPLIDQAIAQLDDAIRQARRQPTHSIASVRRLMGQLAARDVSADGWDQAAQTYLGAAALFHSLNDQQPASRNVAPFRRLLGPLEFPRNDDGPRRFTRPQYEHLMQDLRREYPNS